MTHFRLNAVAIQIENLMTLSKLLRSIAARYKAVLKDARRNVNFPTKTRCERSCDEYLSSYLPQNIDYEISIASIQLSRTRHIHWMVSIRIPSLGSRWKLADAYIWKSSNSHFETFVLNYSGLHWDKPQFFVGAIRQLPLPRAYPSDNCCKFCYTDRFPMSFI